MKACKKKGIAQQCLFLARTPAAAQGICNPSLVFSFLSGGTKRHGYSAEILSKNNNIQVITLQFAHYQIGTKMEEKIAAVVFGSGFVILMSAITIEAVTSPSGCSMSR